MGLAPSIGRRAYGIAAIVLGASGLVFGDFAGPWHPVRQSVPHRAALAYLAAVALLAGGVAVQWRRTSRAGLASLATLYFVGALLWMPRVIGYPYLFGVWNGVAEELAMVAAVLVVLAAARVDASPWPTRLRGARALFGLCSVSFGIEHFTTIAQTASMVPPWLPFGQRFWAMATGAAMLAAGLSLIAGILAETAAGALTLLFITFEVLVWIPRVIADPHHQVPWAGSAMNLAVAASSCMVAEVLWRRRQHSIRPVPVRGVLDRAQPTRQ